MVLPQPSPILPQYWPFGCWHATGVQFAPTAPQTPAVPPPPQVWAAEQAPQLTVLPQPSPMTPQYCPFACWQATGVQFATTAPHTLAVPPPPQVWPAGQTPQSMVLP